MFDLKFFADQRAVISFYSQPMVLDVYNTHSYRSEMGRARGNYWRFDNMPLAFIEYVRDEVMWAFNMPIHPSLRANSRQHRITGERTSHSTRVETLHPDDELRTAFYGWLAESDEEDA